MPRLFLFLLVLSLPAACGDTADYPRRRPPEGLLEAPSSVRAGRELFRDHCIRCHGTPAEGRSVRADFHPSAPSFTEDRYRAVDPAYLYWRISTGKTVEPYLSRGSVMPAWEPYLTEDQIWQLVAYIRTRF